VERQVPSIFAIELANWDSIGQTMDSFPYLFCSDSWATKFILDHSVASQMMDIWKIWEIAHMFFSAWSTENWLIGSKFL